MKLLLSQAGSPNLSEMNLGRAQKAGALSGRMPLAMDNAKKRYFLHFFMAHEWYAQISRDIFVKSAQNAGKLMEIAFSKDKKYASEKEECARKRNSEEKKPAKGAKKRKRAQERYSENGGRAI